MSQNEFCGLKLKKKHKKIEGDLIFFGVGKLALSKKKETRILAAVSRAGVCCLELGARKKELVQELGKRFPDAVLVQDDALMAPVIRQASSALKDPEKASKKKPAEALPLDIRGTEFQKKVWSALQEIPRGSLVTYGWIAEKTGSPGAVRAAASACAANKIALIIPCHRVVRADGGLGGYRWGEDLKQKLLKKEGAL